MLHRLLSLYPPAWRARYGDEMEALISDLLARPHRASGRLAASLAFGALREHLRPTVQRVGPPRIAAAYAFGSPLMTHSGPLLERCLGARAEALLEPDEVVAGSFDAVSRYRVAWGLLMWLPLGITMLFNYLMTRSASSAPGAAGGFLAPAAEWFAAIEAILLLSGYAVSKFLLRATHAQRLTFALTNHGIVTFRNGRFNRPLTIIDRSAATVPEVVRNGRRWRQIRLGHQVVWVHRRSWSVLDWMMT